MKVVPERTCIACHNHKPKNELIRIVKDAEGNFSLDFTGKKAGRGAYVCNNIECIQKCAKTKALNKAFKTNVPQEVYDAIVEQYNAEQN
ncbi:MAG: RNase P modulator RnpM [Christensenellales bacterium]